MSTTGGCRGFTTIVVLEDITGLDFGIFRTTKSMFFRLFGFFCKIKWFTEVFFILTEVLG